jgi:hypothetical protein
MFEKIDGVEEDRKRFVTKKWVVVRRGEKFGAWHFRGKRV